jgi:hypothetical protein
MIETNGLSCLGFSETLVTRLLGFSETLKSLNLGETILSLLLLKEREELGEDSTDNLLYYFYFQYKNNE